MLRLMLVVILGAGSCFWTGSVVISEIIDVFVSYAFPLDQ